MMITRNTLLFLVLFLFSSPCTCLPADFYLDPVNGSMSNDGSQSHPWTTLQEVYNAGKIETRDCSAPCSTTSPVYVPKHTSGPVKPGDTLYLMSGYHGSFSLTGGYNADWIYVKAYPGQTPQFKQITLTSVANWSFDGISVSPSHDATFSKVSFIVNILDHSWTGSSHYVTVKNSSIFSVDDSSAWTTKDDWRNNASGGLTTWADHTLIENVVVKNVAGGVKFYDAPYSIMRNSLINWTCMDGLWVFYSDYTKIEYNTIKNVVNINYNDENHYDLMQMVQNLDLSLPLTGVEVMGNTLIAYENQNQLSVADVGGINGTDGWYDNCIISNNLVVTNSYDGITLTGARNSTIINNTVLNGFTFDTYPPNGAPVSIYGRKPDSTPGYGNVIRNNITPWINMNTNGEVDTVDHNLVTTVTANSYPQTSGTIRDANLIPDGALSSNFVSPSTFDYRLVSGAQAVNAGSVTGAPLLDKLQNARDSQPDIGAYEYSSIATYRYLRLKTDGKLLHVEQ